MTSPDPLPEPEPPLEGGLTAEEVDDALRNGITFEDLIRDLEEADRKESDVPAPPGSV